MIDDQSSLVVSRGGEAYEGDGLVWGGFMGSGIMVHMEVSTFEGSIQVITSGGLDCPVGASSFGWFDVSKANKTRD